MMKNGFYLHQTKLIGPYKSFQAIQQWILGKKQTFLFSQGVILVIFMLKFRHFQSIEFEICSWIMLNAFYIHQSKLIGPYKSFQAIQQWILGEKQIFLFSPGGHFGDCRAEISPFSVHRIRNLYLDYVKHILYIHQRKLIGPYKSFQAIHYWILGEKSTFSFSQGVILVIFMLKFRHFQFMEFEICAGIV